MKSGSLRQFVIGFNVCRNFIGAVLGFVIFMAAAYPLSAYAADESIISQSATTVLKGEKVEDVVVFGHNADIFGHITDTLIVINGDAHLAANARVGIVVDIGGTLQVDPGAYAEHIFTLSYSKPLMNSITVGSALVLSFWIFRLAFSAGLALLPVLVTVLIAPWISTPLTYLESSARRTGLTGLLASIGLVGISGILVFTLIGIPISIFILLLYAILGLIGLGVVSVWIGRLTAQNGIEEKPLWLSSLIGASLMMAFTNVPLVGPILFVMLWVAGVGAVTVWFWHKARSLKNRN